MWPIASWLVRELRLLLAAARAPALWSALLTGLLLWALAYQMPAAHTLHIGGERATRLRWHDEPFLAGFNAPEPARRGGAEWYELPDAPYRWAEDEAEVRLPGMGGGPWLVSVRAASGRPDESAVQSRWQAGDLPPAALTVAPQPRVYRLVAPAAGGDVRLRLSTPPLQGLPDPRTLGVVLYQVRVAPAGGLPRAPAPGMLALLAAALAGIFALVSRLAGPLPRRHEGTKARRTHAVFVSSRPRVFVVSACILIAAYLLAARRADLTIFAPVLAGLVWACYLLAVLLMPLLTAATRRLRVAAGERECGGAVAATVAAFGLRMGGMLHPYHRFSDTGLHVNNLLGVTLRGALFFTEGLPCEAGGGQSPYPPGPYLALAPGALLTGADRPLQTLLLQGGVALLESCSAALVWLLLRRCRVDRAAALLGAALYAFAPPLLRAYAVGEMANLFAQALLLPLLLFLALGAPQAGRPGVTALGTALLAALLLSHTGAAISTAALLAAWLVLRWLGTVRASGATRTHAHEGWANSFAKGVRPFEPPTWPLLLTAVLAVAVAGLLYYSAYLGLFVERRALAAAQAGLPAAERCPVGYPLGQKLYGWVIAPLASPQPALAAPLLAAGAAGMLLMVVPCAERPGARYGARHALGLALAACWLGALLSFATLLTSDQAVRWQPFLFPALCLGGGLALAAWRRHGQAGRTLAYAALGYLAWYAVSDWVRLIGTYLH